MAFIFQYSSNYDSAKRNATFDSVILPVCCQPRNTDRTGYYHSLQQCLSSMVSIPFSASDELSEPEFDKRATMSSYMVFTLRTSARGTIIALTRSVLAWRVVFGFQCSPCLFRQILKCLVFQKLISDSPVTKFETTPSCSVIFIHAHRVKLKDRYSG